MIKETRRFLTALFAVILFVPGAGFAQSFTVSETTINDECGLDSYMEPHTSVANITGNTVTVSLKVTENTLPADWTVTMCLANCFAPGHFNTDEDLAANTTYSFKLTVVTTSQPGSGHITFVITNASDPLESKTVTFNLNATATSTANTPMAPRLLTLAQNYPNPVSLGGSAITTINYGVPKAARITMKVYNLLGREVRTLVNEQKAQGLYTTMWDGRDVAGNLVPTGVYVYKLSNGKNTQTRRILVTR